MPASNSSSSSSDSGWGKTLGLGAAAVAVAGGLFLAYQYVTAESSSSSSSSSGKSKKSKKEKKKAKAAAAAAAADSADVSKEKLVKIFTALIEHANQTIAELTYLEKQLFQANPNITPYQVQQVLVQQYITKTKQVQVQVCQEHGTTEEAVQRASDTYAADATFAPLLAKLTDTNNRVVRGGSSVPQPSAEDLASVPAELTVEKVLTIFTEMMNHMSVAMEATCEEVGAMASPPSQPYALDQLITEMYIKKVESIKSKLLATYGYAENVLDCAVMKYQENPMLIATLNQLKEEHKARAEKARSALDK